MNTINREEIHIISKHSNWSEKNIDHALKTSSYNKVSDWKKFLNFFLLSLGIVFTVSGIVFFFAYNWNDLHKYTKLGIIQAIIVLTTAIFLISKSNDNLKNILLTTSAIIVGVLFAVFGQIYQTGANAYDFFLTWTLAISLWVFVSNFAPLWLLFITLVNTVVFFFAEQVAQNWSDIFVLEMFFLVNFSFLIISLGIQKFSQNIKIPLWFSNVLSLVAVISLTIALINGIFDNYKDEFYPLLFVAIIVYIIGVFYSLKVKQSFYISIISFSIIVLFSSFMLKITDGDEYVFLFLSLFIVVSITAVIKLLMYLHKKWLNE